MANRFRKIDCYPSKQAAIVKTVFNLKKPHSPLGRVLRLSAFFREVLGTGRISLMLLSSLLITVIELAGLALIFPFLKLATDPGFYQQMLERVGSAALSEVNISHKTVVVVLGICLTAGYVLKGLVQIDCLDCPCLVRRNSAAQRVAYFVSQVEARMLVR